MTKAVIFDWDGTLWDALSFIVKTYSGVFEMAGLKPWSRQEYRIRFRHDWKSLLGEMGLAEYEQTLQEHWIRCMKRQKPQAFAWSGPLLQKIGKKAGIAIASSAPREALISELKRSDLFSNLDAIVAQEDVSRIKPDPEPLFLAAQLVGAKPCECIYVGDMVEDIIAAKAAKMASCAVGWGIHEPGILKDAGPDMMAHTHRELEDFIMESL